MKHCRMQVGLAMIALSALCFLAACKAFRPGCLVVKVAAPPLARVIVKGAACKKPEVILRGVTSFCNNELGLCRETVKQTGAIGAIVCPILGEFTKDRLTKLLEKSQLLKDGDCDPAVGAATLVDPIFGVACPAIIQVHAEAVASEPWAP